MNPMLDHARKRWRAPYCDAGRAPREFVSGSATMNRKVTRGSEIRSTRRRFFRSVMFGSRPFRESAIRLAVLHREDRAPQHRRATCRSQPPRTTPYRLPLIGWANDRESRRSTKRSTTTLAPFTPPARSRSIDEP